MTKNKKNKGKTKGRGIRKKKSFLDNQKKHKQNLKRALTDSNLKNDETRFRFENFSTKVSSIEGSLVYQLAGKGNVKVDADSNASVLSETLEYWRELNQSEQFQELDRKLAKFTSLTQVIYNQSEIVNTLSQYLSAGTVLSLQPTVELLAALATDLQHEFCQYLQPVLDILMKGPFKIRDANVIKWSLRCLGHLLKILWKPISTQLVEIYRSCEQLFSLSRPDYIRYLSAETLSFLMRKAGDKQQFLNDILSFDPTVIDSVAVAKLLFESIKTVNEQFNSHCIKLWPMFVDTLVSDHFTVFENLVKFCAEHASKDQIAPLLEVLVTKILDQSSDSSNKDRLLECVILIVDHQSGKMLKSLDQIWKIFEISFEEFESHDVVLKLIKSVLKCDKLLKTKEQGEKLSEIVLGTSEIALEVKLEFISEFSEDDVFDEFLLKPYLSMIQTNIASHHDQLVRHLSEVIVTRDPLPDAAEQSMSWSPPCLDLVIVKELRSINNKEKFSNIILEKLNKDQSPSDILSSSICLASLKPVSTKIFEDKLRSIISDISENGDAEKFSILPDLITIFTSKIKSEESILNVIDFNVVVEKFLGNPSSESLLQTLNYLLNSSSEGVTTDKDKSTRLLECLSRNLSSSNSGIRKMCLQSIIALLPNLGKKVYKQISEIQMSLMEVFNCLLHAENSPENLSSYKEKLNTLERIEFSRISGVFRDEFEFLNVAPLYYLLGLLYTNFTLLWAPVMELIGSYGNGLKMETFWPVFADKLVLADCNIQKVIDNVKINKIDNSSRTDYVSYRNHLWEVLGKFSKVAEIKNGELVPLFLDNFMKIEYLEIRKLAEDKEIESNNKSLIQSTIKSLLSHLNVFAKFQNLKSLHRSRDMRELSNNLLCHKLASVQNVALDILVAYKLKFLLPYKLNLRKFLDDKDFKAELLAFPLAGDDCQIKEEHRDELMPVIMRLLYGRMRAVKAGGRKKGGKGNVNARRGLILQHMMELPESEMMIFFDLVFKDLFTDCSLKPDECVFKYILESKTCPSKTTKQLQACIEMMQVIMGKLSQHLDTSLRYLCSVIVWMGYVLNNLDKTHHENVRSVRNSLYSIMSTFFNKYTKFTWDEDSTSAMMSVFVWKILPKFETDFTRSTSGLIQILSSWSKVEKYHFLFSRIESSGASRILEVICKVLCNPAANPKLVFAILTILHNLTTVEDVEMMETDSSGSKKLGVEIVLKEINVILNYFQTWIKVSNENVKNIKKVGIKLDILVTLAPHISSQDECLILFKQLLTLSNSLKKPESVLKVLTISKLLVHKIPAQELPSLVADLIPFFGRIPTRNERLELTCVIENCTQYDSSLNLVSEICSNLNSFDKKRIEEPDFEKRMRLFRKIRDLSLQSAELSPIELKSIIFNCCFFLKNETESSLKANALEALNSVTKLFCQLNEPEALKELIDKICLDHIKAGIKNKDDSIRCDFLTFLQSLVTNCSESSQRLKDLSKLIDSDPDSNLLENLRHVQLHRRGRAMAKIAANLEEDKNFIKTKNLTQLFLPLAGSYLLNDNYSKNSDLLDQSISLVKSIARCLPWQQYEHSVKYYIEMFTKDSQHQKQLVKITSAVLDAFHFDVGDMAETNKNPKEDTENESLSKEEVQKKKIFWTVNNVLLPKLNGTLSGKTKGANNISDEDKLILRVPLAIPIVKMLKILSAKALHRQVPGIINKIISFLKSKAIEIREAARSTLCSVMELLGPRYLGFVIKEMSSNLQRGYHLHILTFTSHSLMCKLSESGMLSPGDLDSIVSLVTDMAITEMFSTIAEEKEVRKITGKLMEARGSKCYDALQITAKFISNEQLFSLAKPLADKATELSTFKNLQKIRESFRNIVLGLLDNTSLDPVASLIFIYGIVMDKLDIGPSNKKTKNGLEKKEEVSHFIVPVAPKRTGVVAKNSQKTSQHVVHEFGLNLLYFLLKRGSLEANNELHCARLEPFIDILLTSLSSSHVSLITTSVRCLFWLVKFPLSVLDKEKILMVTNKVFELLNKFGGGTDGKGENHDLVVIASKLLVILIRDVELTVLDQNHLKTVLAYVVNDVLDPFKATTAFGLLTAILNRRLETESTELHDVIIKMIELSVQSTNVQTRQAARSTVITYVKNYNLKKKLPKIIDLFCAQLGYEHEFGRLSAAEGIKLLLGVIGAGQVDSQATFIFISLSPHLVNDESSSFKKAIAGTLSNLLTKVSPGVAEKLLQSTLTWYKSPDNPAHVTLACHLLTIFVDNLHTAPFLTSKLQSIISNLSNCLTSNSDSDDHLTIQALTLFSKLLQNSMLEPSSGQVTTVWQQVHTCLLHSHTWARVLSAQLLGLYLSHMSAEKIVNNCLKTSKSVWINNVGTVKALVLDSIEQLSLVKDADTELGTQIVKNIVALSKVTLVSDWESVLESSEDKVTFKWIVKKCLKVANQELVSTPSITNKRVLVFNLVAAACLGSPKSNVEDVLRIVLPPLHRGVIGPVEELKQHCQDVIDLLKSQVDEGMFSEVYLEIQMKLSKQKGERAQSKKQNLILNPEAAAKRKIRINESKKRAKKAKFQNK